MMFFRSKNAKILTLIASILVIVVCVYFHLVSRKDSDNKEEVETPSQVQKLIDTDYDKNYPASVREVVRTYCKVIENLYNEELSDDDFIDLADVERNLMDDELLKKNPYGDFMERLQKEVDQYKNKKTKISDWEVAENDTVSYWYHDEYRYASIYVMIKLTGKSTASIRERFILRYDEDDVKWRILGWDEAADEDADETTDTSTTDSSTKTSRASSGTADA